MEPEVPKEEYIRTVFKTSDYESFYKVLPDKIKDKFDYVINILLQFIMSPLNL